MPKKRAYVKRDFESTGASSDVSANLYASMLLSPAWRGLTASQQRLYTYCKLQLYGEKKKPKTEDYPDGNERFFTMNKLKWSKTYGLYRENNAAAFYRDMAALVDAGFVVVVESGRLTRTKSIYALSGAWKDAT